ncbi:MAG: 16S rRNA (cytosine(967)-C(5))-methyltransferase RsmB [Lachnospiraceae bacterium]|nr:16S rRNA (cytosine(967)-C(5))-methyltransferase RsmB [Candidatus Colinaster scatohippi]
MGNNNAINIRELITEILLSIDKGEEHSHILIKNVLDKYDYLPQNDKNFIKRVTEGTLENRIRIDYIINSFSKTPVNKMKPLIRNLVRMSVYQIIYMDKVPDSAVCNEAVKIAGKRGFRGLQGFVNGVLRSIARGKDEINWPSDKDDSVKAISVLFSCPELIVESLINDYGVKETRRCLAASLEESNLYVRLDERLNKSDIDEIKAEWDENEISFVQSEELTYAYKLSGADKLGKLKAFVEGKYAVQDLSSMLVCEMAGIKAGDTVLDMCAAPGGKSAHAAIKLAIADAENSKNSDASVGVKRGRVISRDVTDYKVRLIEDNIERLGLSNIWPELWDATIMDDEMNEMADVVIADVPCSGIGVIGRKPDIKYNLTSEGLASIVELQRQIIDNAVSYVKPGGTLMYSTCTMRKAENDENVDYILSTGKYELVETKQLFINEDHDGFFIAKLIRK